MRAKHITKKTTLKEDIGSDAHVMERDHEVQMARADLFKLAKYSIELHKMLQNVSEEQGLEGWVQAKITKAADYIGSVKHHLEYEMLDTNAQAGMPDAEIEGPAEEPIEIVPQESIKGE